MKILWVLVSCNSHKEADTVGKQALKKRLAACFDIVPRKLTRYFWPPKSSKVMSGKGCLLILNTLPKFYSRITRLIKKLHSDKVPFIGSLEINNVNPAYVKWLKSELQI